MAARIRNHDWAATPLGPADCWPQSLRTAVDLVLDMPAAAMILWGPERVQIYNDAYVAIARDRHPGLLGCPAAGSGADAHDPVIAPLLESALAGKATRLTDFMVPFVGPGGPEERVFDADWSPLRDETGAVAGALEILVEVTSRHKAEAVQREGEARQAFLLQLSDAVRPLVNPVDIQAETTRLLRGHLDAGWAYYVDWDLDRQHGLVRRDSVREGLPSLAGAHDVSAAPGFLQLLAGGATQTVSDYANYEQLPPCIRQKFLDLCFRSMMMAPLVRQGRLIATLFVGDTKVREWSEDEASLLAEVAERTWAAIERGRAEAAVRESEQQLRDVLDSMSEGFALFDPDFTIRDVNAETVRLVGRTREELIGRNHWEAFPGTEYSPLGELYRQVMRDRVPRDIEFAHQWPDGRTMWVEARVYPTTHGRIACRWQDITERKCARTALHDSEERFRSLFASSPASFLILDIDAPFFTILDVNDAYLAATMRTRDDLIGRSLFEAFPDNPDDSDPVGVRTLRASLERVLATRRADTLPDLKYDVARPDGSFEQRWWSPVNAPLLNADGEVTAIIHHVKNVTEQYRAQQALRESEERLRLVVEGARDYAIFTIDAERRVDDWYGGAETVFGYSAEEIRGLDAGRLYTPEDRAKGEDNKELARACETGSAPNVRWHVCKDGRQVFIEGHVVALRGSDGALKGYLKIGQDVTEARRVQQALSESEERLRTLTEGIPQLVWRSGHKGHWTWSSPQWQAFTGQTLEASLGLGWLDALHPDDRDAAIQAWHEAVSNNGMDVEYRVRRCADGVYLWHHTRSVPVRDANGRIVEWLGTTTDVQELKEMQERQAVLVAELQHRTHNLMAVVRAMAEKTARSSADLADFRARFRDRLEALSRVQGLLSRLKEHDRVKFEELLRNELAAMGGSDRVRLEGPSNIRLRSSAVQTLAMVLHELATNAVKYGALGQANAQLAITWWLDPSHESGEPWLYIDWRESGVVMPGAAELTVRGTGQGRELIESALAYQLGGTTSYVLGPDGVHCTMAVPVFVHSETENHD